MEYPHAFPSQPHDASKFHKFQLKYGVVKMAPVSYYQKNGKKYEGSLSIERARVRTQLAQLKEQTPRKHTVVKPFTLSEKGQQALEEILKDNEMKAIKQEMSVKVESQETQIILDDEDDDDVVISLE